MATFTFTFWTAIKKSATPCIGSKVDCRIDSPQHARYFGASFGWPMQGPFSYFFIVYVKLDPF